MFKNSDLNIYYTENLRSDEVRIIRNQVYRPYSSCFLIIVFSSITLIFWQFQVFFVSVISLILLLLFLILWVILFVKTELEIKEGKKLVIKGKIQKKDTDRMFDSKSDSQGRIVSYYFMIESHKINVTRKIYLRYVEGQTIEIRKLPKSDFILKISNI